MFNRLLAQHGLLITWYSDLMEMSDSKSCWHKMEWKFRPTKKVPGRRPSRSHSNRPLRSQGTNFETKIFKFRRFLGLSDQNELYHILWDDHFKLEL